MRCVNAFRKYTGCPLVASDGKRKAGPSASLGMTSRWMQILSRRGEKAAGLRAALRVIGIEERVLFAKDGRGLSSAAEAGFMAFLYAGARSPRLLKKRQNKTREMFLLRDRI
jgi:hypothetical protein